MKITTLKDIIIPAGTILEEAPRTTKRAGYHGDFVIGFGNDGAGFFTIDQESAELSPESFSVTEK